MRTGAHAHNRSPAILALLIAAAISVQLMPATDVHAGTGEADTKVLHGRFEVNLAAIDGDGERGKIARHLRQVLPRLDDVYGPPPRRLDVNVVMDKSLGTKFRVSPDSCRGDRFPDSVRAGEPENLTFYVRALASLYWSCDHLADPWFDDGLAEAVNQMTLQAIGMRAPWRMERVQYAVANRPGIGAGKSSGGDAAARLQQVRFRLLATAFRIFEEDHPGFLRRFNALRGQRPAGSPATALDYVALAGEVEPSFSAWALTQHLFDDRPRGHSILLVAQGDRVELLAVQRDEFGKETMWPSLHVTVSIDPLGKDMELVTDGEGEASIELTEVGYPRPGRMVTLRARGGGLSDELTFMPVPPEAGAGGAPNPWDLAIWVLGGSCLLACWWTDRRAQRRAKDGPIRLIPSRVEPYVRGGAVLAFVALCGSVGFGGLTRAATRLDNARWMLRTGAQPADAVRTAPPGQRVVVAGRIDPRLLPMDRSRGFVLYFGEYYSTESTWEWDYTVAQPFTAILDDGPVEVVNGCGDANAGWTIARAGFNDDCYRLLDLPVTEYNGDGNDRFRGFKPGDPVVVFGVTRAGGINATAVSGGTLHAYAADVRRDAWGRVFIACVWLALALAALLAFLHSVARQRHRGAGPPPSTPQP